MICTMAAKYNNTLQTDKRLEITDKWILFCILNVVLYNELNSFTWR